MRQFSLGTICYRVVSESVGALVRVSDTEDMNKPAAIILAVAGYSIAEVIILFSLVSPSHSYAPTLYQKAVVFGQLILIPGMAALISRVIYGPYQCLRRTSAILIYGILAAPVAVIAVFLMLLPVLILAWSYDVSRILFAVALPLVTLAVLMGVVFLVRKSGKWAVKAEAERWLAERQAGISHSDHARRSCSIGFAVCIPALLVLSIFLFLPETWGLFSHFAQTDMKSISGYRVTIPPTWIITFHHEFPDGSSGVSGICGKGIGRGVNPLRYDSLSSWSLGTDSYDQQRRKYYHRPEESDVLRRTDLTVGGEPMSCFDYWPTYDYGPGRSESSRIAHVTCSGSGRQYADFDGMRSQLPAFYEMLTSIKPR